MGDGSPSRTLSLDRLVRSCRNLRHPAPGPEVVVANSKQTVGIVEKMVLAGATSLCPTVPYAPGSSTTARRLRIVVARRRHSHNRHRRQGRAPMIIGIAEIGPPVDNVRQTPPTCW